MIFPDKTGLEPACGNAKEVDVQNTMTVKQLKEILPDISYEEIRCVLAGLQQEQQAN